MMEDASTTQKPTRWWLVILILIGVSAGGYGISMLLQPQRYAEALYCLEQQRDGSRQNVCEREIEVAYCLKNPDVPRDQDLCNFQTLAPGAAFDNWVTASEPGKPYWMACKTPYRPAMKPTTRNTGIYEKGCRKSPEI